MKTQFTTPVLCCVFATIWLTLSASTGHAQDLSGGLKAGISSVRGRRGELLSTAFAQPAVGASFRYGLSRTVAVQPELYLAVKGVRWERTAPEYIVDQSILGYLEVPALLTVSPLGRGRHWSPFLVAGPSLSVLLSCSQMSQVQVGSVPEPIQVSWPCDRLDDGGRPRYVTNRFEFGMQVGLGLEVAVPVGRISLEARHAYGLTSIQPGAEPAVLNRRLSVLVGFVRVLK